MTKRWDIFQTQMWVFTEEKKNTTTSLWWPKTDTKVCSCKRSKVVSSWRKGVNKPWAKVQDWVFFFFFDFERARVFVQRNLKENSNSWWDLVYVWEGDEEFKSERCRRRKKTFWSLKNLDGYQLSICVSAWEWRPGFK